MTPSQITEMENINMSKALKAIDDYIAFYEAIGEIRSMSAIGLYIERLKTIKSLIEAEQSENAKFRELVGLYRERDGLQMQYNQLDLPFTTPREDRELQELYDKIEALNKQISTLLDELKMK